LDLFARPKSQVKGHPRVRRADQKPTGAVDPGLGTTGPDVGPVDAEAFVGRRNPPPQLFASPRVWQPEPAVEHDVLGPDAWRLPSSEASALD